MNIRGNNQTLVESSDSVEATPDATPQVVSDYAVQVVILVNICIVCFIISSLGTMANIVNIVVFVKQGFSDTINISLVGLTISDLGVVVTTFWMSICYNPMFQRLELPFIPVDVQHVTASWPHFVFTRISSWITVYITFERCLCIALPLKVKIIINHTRTMVIIVLIYIIVGGSISPAFVVNRLQWKFVPRRNKTMFGLVFAENRPEVEGKMFIYFNSVLNFGSFFLVTICTAILSVKLVHKSRWRERSSATKAPEHVSQRERRLIGMVWCIACIFITCFLPVSILLLAMSLVPELLFGARYGNVYNVCITLVTVLQTVNSSLNILVYLGMSSKYREMLKAMCSGGK